MVTLEALCEDDHLVSGMSLADLALRCHSVIRRSPELLTDVTEENLRLAELRGDDIGRWILYWRRNPIAAWTGERRARRTWFRLDGDRFALDLTVRPEFVPTLTQMTRELVDYRLAQYLARKRQGEPSIEGFICKVISNQRDPIVKLPPRTSIAIPEGEADVRLPQWSSVAIPLRKGVLQRSPPGRFPAESASRLAPRMVRTARRTTRHSLPDQVPRRIGWSVGRASSNGRDRKRP